ncbi:hypothetical protein L227DRAFT_125471 [Lentinus tigrinus ALCF2SS1-6]|uniref:Uncharacterized protein n=1 Tax=Lentinus tigrinus ALCF2SS1-6 TaxID=1328759 RepID=A0A5C2SQ21_9APHY|nr:hypothetical protein L227DRAFT_125471 [Lentinus tigrinus ALCF2SS1-6]
MPDNDPLEQAPTTSSTQFPSCVAIQHRHVAVLHCACESRGYSPTNIMCSVVLRFHRDNTDRGASRGKVAFCIQRTQIHDSHGALEYMIVCPVQRAHARTKPASSSPPHTMTARALRIAHPDPLTNCEQDQAKHPGDVYPIFCLRPRLQGERFR